MVDECDQAIALPDDTVLLTEEEAYKSKVQKGYSPKSKKGIRPKSKKGISPRVYSPKVQSHLTNKGINPKSFDKHG